MATALNPLGLREVRKAGIYIMQNSKVVGGGGGGYLRGSRYRKKVKGGKE